MYSFFGLFILLAGFVVGLGAVTVIDIHGLLGRTSRYWTEATTRTHKVTKPLIWIGIALAVMGGTVFYSREPFSGIVLIHALSVPLMVLNGLFLSYSVIPYLLARERQGKQAELLPRRWQAKIALSLVVSDILWWGNLVLVAVFLSRVIP